MFNAAPRGLFVSEAAALRRYSLRPAFYASLWSRTDRSDHALRDLRPSLSYLLAATGSDRLGLPRADGESVQVGGHYGFVRLEMNIYLF